MNDRTTPSEDAPWTGRVGLLAISGSSRTGSRNARLLDVAVKAALAIPADVSVLDVRDLDLPIYATVLGTAPMPQGGLVIRQILCAHDGLLIATPGYAGSLPLPLRNALDWGSLPPLRVARPTPFRGKIAAIMSVSDDLDHALAALHDLRAVLEQIGVIVLPDALAFAGETFDTRLDSNPAIVARVRRQVRSLVDALRTQQSGTTRR